jgi:hypothetical protein
MTRSPFTALIMIATLAGTAYAEEASEEDPNKPKRGSFDAGVEVRFPSGPDEMGEFAQFNWVAVDIKGRYFVLDQLTLNATIPLAPVKQDLLDPFESHIFGGFLVGPELALDKKFGLGLNLGFLTEGAFLLSPKDAPIYIGDLKFGASVGPWIKFKPKSFGVEFNFVPHLVYQATDDTLIGLQVPISAVLSLGKSFKLALDTGIYTGDDFDPRPSKGGRLALGASIDLKISKIIVHAGAGFASLLTTDEPEMGVFGTYPKIGDSIYIDLNVKYAK